MRTLLLMVCLLTAIVVFAQPQGHRVPPFVTACKSKSAGDSCSFRTRNGSAINGTCIEKQHPRTGESELVCWNENMMNHKRRPPKGGNR